MPGGDPKEARQHALTFLASLGKSMRLFVVVQGDEIIVTSETGFRTVYWKRPNFPQLKVRRCTDWENHELLARAWQAANDKARELGWIV